MNREGYGVGAGEDEASIPFVTAESSAAGESNVGAGVFGGCCCGGAREGEGE